jgi:arylsulfatase A-like enzyme
LRKAENILFIMCDQLRWDYLSCYGHPHLRTPNIDRLAERGTRFTRVYVQSPVCGASRMSFYTGRYVQSHGASWNGFPLKVGEMTLGDYLRARGMDVALVGKTHMRADTEGMERLGIDPDSIIGVRVSECGFDPFERDDGLHGIGPDGRYESKNPRYNEYLRDKGYNGTNPWHDWANSAAGDGNKIASGWAMRHASRPARVAEEDSETPYMTRRAIEFMEQASKPWCLHLSYIKPHWPYIAPAPYNSMFGKDAVQPAVRSERERENPHPIYREFMELRVSRNFGRDEVREEVIPVYMGLIKQIDDQMGVLFDYMNRKGLMDNTVIVFTSDHGDYLGDHWLGEKDLFHEQSVKIPLIVYDPRTARQGGPSNVCDELVESIDIVPTLLDAIGGDSSEQSHRMEGRSLTPLLNGEKPAAWRNYAISEYDYSMLPVAMKLKIEPRDARLYMVTNKEWKYVCAPGFRPMLYDLVNDPSEFNDLGDSPGHAAVREKMQNVLNAWGLRYSQRTTRSEKQILAARGKSIRKGILIGVWDENEIPEELWSGYLGNEN